MENILSIDDVINMLDVGGVDFEKGLPALRLEWERKGCDYDYLRRALAAYIGTKFDELKEKPLSAEVNEFYAVCSTIVSFLINPETAAYNAIKDVRSTHPAEITLGQYGAALYLLSEKIKASLTENPKGLSVMRRFFGSPGLSPDFARASEFVIITYADMLERVEQHH